MNWSRHLKYIAASILHVFSILLIKSAYWGVIIIIVQLITTFGLLRLLKIHKQGVSQKVLVWLTGCFGTLLCFVAIFTIIGIDGNNQNNTRSDSLLFVLQNFLAHLVGNVDPSPATQWFATILAMIGYVLLAILVDLIKAPLLQEGE